MLFNMMKTTNTGLQFDLKQIIAIGSWPFFNNVAMFPDCSNYLDEYNFSITDRKDY